MGTAFASADPVAPTAPGWYGYSGGRHVMVFHLDSNGQWRAYFENGDSGKCAWAYIAQALSVWDLIPLALH